MGSIMIVGGAMFGVRALNRTDTLNSYQAGDTIQDLIELTKSEIKPHSF